tara:strand:- start:5518 stop:6225 length:708 start_codon:yes stop_codon:yes gene_type:complete
MRLSSLLLGLILSALVGCVSFPCEVFQPFQPCRKPSAEHYRPPVIIVPQSPNPAQEVGVSLLVEPTELLPKALRGIAELCCKTPQFQVETGENAADSLDLFCHWPDVPESSLDGDGNALTAPLFLVTYDVNLGLTLVQKQFAALGKGELFCQMALAEDPAIVDHRDRATDVFNRHGKIMRTMLELCHSDNSLWRITDYSVPTEIALNDLTRYPFVDEAGAKVRVRIFPNVVTWIG